MDKLDLGRKNLRKFGFTMGIASLIIALLIMFNHRHNPALFFLGSGIFFGLALVIPGILKPAYILWMKFAFILSWVNTRIILCVVFYLVLTPIAMLVRLFGKDLLDRRIEKEKKSYWRKKERRVFKREDYERQF